MDAETVQLFSDEDREMFIRMDTLDIMQRMNSVFSCLTRTQQNMPFEIARARRSCMRQKGVLPRLFHAVSRYQARVELNLYSMPYAGLAQGLADLNNKIVGSKSGTDYTDFIPELESMMNAIALHMDYVKNRLDIVRGTETKRKFELQ